MRFLRKYVSNWDAAPVQHIGKIFIIYRPKPEETEKKSAHTIHRKKREAFRAKRSFQN